MTVRVDRSVDGVATTVIPAHFMTISTGKIDGEEVLILSFETKAVPNLPLAICPADLAGLAECIEVLKRNDPHYFEG